MRLATQDAHDSAGYERAKPLQPKLAPPQLAPPPLPRTSADLMERQGDLARDAAQIDATQLDAATLLALAGTAGSESAMGIARQVADMAQGLAALADRLVGQNEAASTDVAEADCVAFLESQFRIRRLRGRHLPGLSLGEPAWDILLDLAVAQHWHRETSVTSLCIAADVPSTTALRWINSMTREGLIVRRACLRDGRRSFLAIAPGTFQAMLALAADALRADQKVRARYQRNAAA
jgi:DNA-binding MarR family transcriptional regulator